MKKITTVLLTIFLAISSYAQTSFFDALKSYGSEARFLEYYSVTKGEKENTTKISGKRYWVTIEVETLPSGIPIAFDLIKEEDGKSLDGETAISDYGRLIGFPNVSSIYHSYRQDGYIAIDDYIFKISNISKDGSSFGSIDKIFIKENKEIANSSNSKAEKKKKFGAIMGNIAKAAIGDADEAGGSGPEYKKATSMDLHQLVSNYLKEMSSKQSSYTLTASDKNSIQEIEKARNDKDAYYKTFNDSVKATPEYQKMLEQQNMITLKSRSSETIYVWTKYPGKEMNSSYSFYLSNYGDTNLSFCENKTLYYTTSPVSNGAKFMREITKRDCKKTILIP